MWQYETVLVEDHPDRLLNSRGTAGWECFAVVAGGYDSRGSRHLAAFTLYFRRPRPEEPPEAFPPRTVGPLAARPAVKSPPVPGRRRGRPPGSRNKSAE